MGGGHKDLARPQRVQVLHLVAGRTAKVILVEADTRSEHQRHHVDETRQAELETRRRRDGTGSAVFASTGIKSWKKAGKFQFVASEGKEWEEWILLTCLGLYEKARRRAIARRDLSWFV